MKLRLRSLPFDTQEFNYHLDGDFFNRVEKTDVRSSSVDITLLVTRKAENTYLLQMACKGELVVPCDRCLEDLVLPVNTDYRLTIRQVGDEWDDSRDQVLLVPEAWTDLDFTDLIRDTVLLTIPIVHSHDDGKCNELMMQRLGEHWIDSEPDVDGEEPLDDDESDGGNIDPRWEALRKLKDNN